MNKAQLIEALADRLGDKKTAQGAVDGITDVIIRAVHKGDKVNITGFGVFEKRARAARTARNPRTGETVKVKKTNVPAFRAGSTFKDVVSGQKKLPRVTAASKAGGTARATATATATATKPATKPAAKPAARATTSSRPAAAKTTAAKAPAARKTAAKAAPKATAKRTTTTAKAPAAKRTTRKK